MRVSIYGRGELPFSTTSLPVPPSLISLPSHKCAADTSLLATHPTLPSFVEARQGRPNSFAFVTSWLTPFPHYPRKVFSWRIKPSRKVGITVRNSHPRRYTSGMNCQGKSIFPDGTPSAIGSWRLKPSGKTFGVGFIVYRHRNIPRRFPTVRENLNLPRRFQTVRRNIGSFLSAANRQGMQILHIHEPFKPLIRSPFNHAY